MRKVKSLLVLSATFALFGGASSVYAAGNLLAVGGQLRASNTAIYKKLVDLGGGLASARIAIMPTAAKSMASSEKFKNELLALGVPAEHITIVPIDRTNYAERMNDPQAAKTIKDATAVWFVGGDQSRISKALYNADGSPSMALQAVTNVYDKGGVIAGSSAGASAMSVYMPTAYGSVIDTLDFGIAKSPEQRGTALLRGAGLFKYGIIDQHFDQIKETTTGRAGRMASYLVDGPEHTGFGLETNTAMWVKPSGELEVIGEGYLTIMDAGQATREFGTFGTEVRNIRLAMLSNGDRYNFSTHEITIAPGKQQIKPGNEALKGNELIPDLSAVAAIRRAVLFGLADNSSSIQTGLMTRYNLLNGYHHSYRFDFTKTAEFKSYNKSFDSLDSYTAEGVRLDIVPVDASLNAPTMSTPNDIETEANAESIKAVVYRGLMTTNADRNFEPDRPITKGELANTLYLTLGSQLTGERRPSFPEVQNYVLRDQAEIVVGNGWMASGEHFNPQERVNRTEWEKVAKLMFARNEAIPTGLTPSVDTSVPRREVAYLIALAYRLSSDKK